MRSADRGPNPFVGNIDQMAACNENFRTAIWTGRHLQVTLMCIPTCGEIGLEIHGDTDQILRVEQGRALVVMGGSRERLDFRRNIGQGDMVVVPAGTWHNVMNTGRCPLKLTSVYGPPNHPRGTIHRTKAEADREEYNA